MMCIAQCVQTCGVWVVILAGDQDGEPLRLTLIAQGNVLSSDMPFLLERVDNRYNCNTLNALGSS